MVKVPRGKLSRSCRQVVDNSKSCKKSGHGLAGGEICPKRIDLKGPSGVRYVWSRSPMIDLIVRLVF